MMSPSWPEHYLGIKWLSGGRDPVDGLDCYGLVRLVYRREFDIDMPEHPVPTGTLATREMVESNLANFYEPAAPRPGDIVALGKVGAGMSHVGVFCLSPAASVLHITENARAHVVTLHSLYRNGFTLQKFYRHAKHSFSY